MSFEYHDIGCTFYFIRKKVQSEACALSITCFLNVFVLLRFGTSDSVFLDLQYVQISNSHEDITLNYTTVNKL